MVGNKEIPKWAEVYFTKNDLDHLEQVVKEQERKTSGEIVPMIVRSTVSTPRTFVLFFSILSALGLIAFDGFKLHSTLYTKIGIDAVVLLCAALLAFILDQLNRKHLFTLSKIEIKRQVDVRAKIEFFDRGLHNTAGKTGILIFLSLLERRAVVLADKGIADKLDQNIWREVLDHMLSHAKQSDLKLGLEKAIIECGNLLATHFPPDAKNLNELSDHLILKI